MSWAEYMCSFWKDSWFITGLRLDIPSRWYVEVEGFNGKIWNQFKGLLNQCDIPNNSNSIEISYLHCWVLNFFWNYLTLFCSHGETLTYVRCKVHSVSWLNIVFIDFEFHSNICFCQSLQNFWINVYVFVLEDGL